MEDCFEIPVTYQGQERCFPCRLRMLGYTHQFRVDVDDQQIIFEPDEEGNYRAVLDWQQLKKDKKIAVELLQAIAEVIESVISAQ